MTSCAAGSPTPRSQKVEYTAFTSKKRAGDHRPADRPPRQRPQPPGPGKARTNCSPSGATTAVFTDSPFATIQGRGAPPRPRPGRTGIRGLDRRPPGPPALRVVPRETRPGLPSQRSRHNLLRAPAGSLASLACAKARGATLRRDPQSTVAARHRTPTAAATSPCTCPKAGTASRNG